MLALFIIISGMTFSYEMTIFSFFKSYNYFPMIIPQSPIDDGLAGNLFSQFSVTASAMLIAVYNLKYYWFFVFSLMYGLIEEFFVRLGIYSHYWYQTWMTMLGLFLLFWLTKRMYKIDLKNIKHFWRYILMFFGLFTLHMPAIFWALILTKIIVLNINILPDPMNSYALIRLLNLLFLSITCTFIYFSKLNWQWKSILTFCLYGSLYLACKLNLINVKEGMFFVFASIDILGMYLCVFILDKLMYSD